VEEREPDYEQMSLDELQDAAAHIDRREFPQRARRVDAELSKRANAAPLDWFPYRLGIPMWIMALVLMIVILGIPLGICGVLLR
jgi:hypothetical protein